MLALAAGIVLAASSAACSGSSGAASTQSTWASSASAGCTLSTKEVPSCGTLWGIAVKPPTPARWKQVETQVGRSFDFIYRYHDTGPVRPELRAQARGVASIKKPVFVTFEQEANQNAKLSRGSGTDFTAAWRHLHRIYQDEGATNAVWVWVMTGSADNLDRAAQLWPGNDVVDWISWNVYNQSGCPTGTIAPAQYVSFEKKMKIFYTFVKTRGPAMGMTR